MEGIFWPVVLIVAGIVLVVLEMFVPSAGALGIFAALAFLGAVCIGYYESAYIGTGTLATIALIIPLLLAVFAQWWPHTPLGRRMLLRRAPEDAHDDVDDQEEHLRS
ncbi:MAG TPA: hypothetical protein VL096_12275, partial [Pirellulaceae bacterium]|nr:hypothetical protein [Pirellulaceae bacterium]